MTTGSFEGEITVSSRVIDQLSSGLYETPAACLKELINNSFDADARRVTLSVRPDASTIILEDDGDGFNRATFERHFKRIAQSHKRDESDHTRSGRPKVGKIGIGFIAANEICNRMEIVSTMSGSSELMTVEIDFGVLGRDLEDRERPHDDIAKADFIGEVTADAGLDEHYTRIYLRDVKGEAQDVLRGAQPGRGPRSLYGLLSKSVRDILDNDNVTSWDEFDSYSRAGLEIALNVPIRYHENWAPTAVMSELSEFSAAANRLNFTVTLDSTELRKPIVLRDDPDGSLLRRFTVDSEHVSGSGYFYATSGAIRPKELNGLLLRIRNAAVGSYDRSYLNFPGYQSALFQDWTSGEFWADDRLEESLNIDRRTLRTTTPAYVELRDALHAELRLFLADVRRELYGRRSDRRKVERAADAVDQLDALAQNLAAVIGEESADALSAAWRPSVQPRPPLSRTAPSPKVSPRRSTPNSEAKRLTQKFDAPRVLNVVREAAADAGLDSEQTAAVLRYVADHLLG